MDTKQLGPSGAAAPTGLGSEPQLTTRIASPKRGRAERKEARIGRLFVAPFILLFSVVFLVPMIVALRQSLFTKKASGGGLFGGGEAVDVFVGFENYAVVVSDTRFWAGIGRVVGYAAFQIPAMILMALALALVLDSFLTRHVTIYRLGFFLPYAVPGIVAAMVWMYLYTPEISPIVKGLSAIGLDVNFMGEYSILFSMANMTTWTFTGYNMLIFLAALQAIPHDLYEAARLDGASGLQVTLKVKVPLVRGAALLTVLLSIIGTIQLFNEPSVMATVNPWMGNDYTPMMMAYNTMMGQISPGGDGPASAISIVMALIAGALAVVYALLQRKKD